MSNYTKKTDALGEPTPLALCLRLVGDVIGGFRGKYVLFVAAVIAFGLASLLPAQLFRYFTDGISTLHAQPEPAVFIRSLVIFGFAVGVGLFISHFGQAICQEWLRLRVEGDLRRQVLQRLHQMPVSALDGSQRGDLLSRMSGDLSQVEIFITDSLPIQIRQLAILVGAFTLFVLHAGALAFVPLLSALGIAGINLMVQRYLSPILGNLRELHGGVFQMLLESLEGMRTIRSHNAEPYVERRFEGRLQEINSRSLNVVRTLGALIGGTELVTKLFVTLCLAVAAFWLASDRLSWSDVLIFPFFIGMFYDAAQSLAGQAYDWNRFLVQGRRLAELLYSSRTTSERVTRTFRKEELSTISSLSLSQVRLGYEGVILTPPLNLQIDRSQIWAIVGPSGSGKSTLLESLAGLRSAVNGQYALADKTGRSVWQSDGQQIKLPVGVAAYVEQNPYVFEGTLRENLTFSNPGRLSDAVLWTHLERARLFELTNARGGLDSVIRDRGQNLSIGEKYRLALCRALLLQRPFILLDEPFAALDEKSIECVIAILEEEKKNSGIIIVTHYLPHSLRVDGIYNFETFRSEKRPEIAETSGEKFTFALSRPDLSAAQQHTAPQGVGG